MKLTTFLFKLLILLIPGEEPNKTKVPKYTIHNHDPITAIGDTVPSPDNNIMTIYQDKKNIYWFGSWVNGLYRYDGVTVLHFTQKDGLPGNRIEEIKEDQSGIIYINTNKGICKYDGQRFISLNEAFPIENGWKLLPTDLWFKSLQHPGHVYRYSGNALYRLKLPKITPGEEFVNKHPTSPSPYIVYCIYQDSRRNVWFGTSVLGACRYNGTSFDWITEEDVTELHDGPSNGVRSIIEDKDGYFWFNSNYRYAIYESPTFRQKNATNNVFYKRIQGIGNLDGKKDSNLGEYLSIARDKSNHLWIATYRNGVYKVDEKKTQNYIVRDGLKEITLFYIYHDNQGKLWLATPENGLFTFNGNEFEKFKP